MKLYILGIKKFYLQNKNLPFSKCTGILISGLVSLTRTTTTDNVVIGFPLHYNSSY